jgi:histidinol-phosphate aminotransferase
VTQGAVAGTPAGRPGLDLLPAYHSPQVEVDVRLNTNESPEPPPPAFMRDLATGLGRLDLRRYPDREAAGLRDALAQAHGVTRGQIWCGNGSNEVLQALFLAYGGHERTAAVFEPTYALHSHIARITSTPCFAGRRGAEFLIEEPELERALAERPDLVLLCSPNNPTGRMEPRPTIARVIGESSGIVVVDEAYGQFAPSSAAEMLATAGGSRLAVVRTFSKTWALAGLRLGYVVASPEIVDALARVSLPYHIDAVKQLAGTLALAYEDEMRARIARVVAERERLAQALAHLAVEVWPSDANFLLFRPRDVDGHAVWEQLLARSVLVRDISSWPGLEGCLRVTVGTAQECDRFVDALTDALAASARLTP